jgi:transcriptional regulator with XRE-family HTH domain
VRRSSDFDGSLVRDRRERLGFTREVVSVRIGRSKESLSLYEKGVEPPPLVLQALAEVLECDPSEFFERERVTAEAS